ncbi:hypothetical protein ALC56_06126 [Trachymyrmex septentrionalis]|uniref:Uncharacterized protein n=1 Tax=Trachymyrmex septentrionalis TaxID=34720 RepID=A0A195FHD2_9HYME|nr:hypothetical protein ALC56_06126 [Trachymyrmex septentrionalis]
MPLPANSGGLNLRGTIVNHAAIPRYVAGRWRCVIGVNLSESGINLRQSNSGAAHIQQRIALQPQYRSTSGISATTNLEPRPRLRTCSNMKQLFAFPRYRFGSLIIWSTYREISIPNVLILDNYPVSRDHLKRFASYDSASVHVSVASPLVAINLTASCHPFPKQKLA